MLLVRDIVARVAAKCDDADLTYITEDYVSGFLDDTQDWLFGKLRLANNQFSEEVVVLGNVAAGTPNLDAFQITGQPLGAMCEPKILRWRLPGQSNRFWRKASGPLDYPQELDPGSPSLDSWAWIRNSIKLANFSTNLDIEVTGDFLFDHLADPDDAMQMTQLANRTFTCKLASEVGKARGNDKWVTTYGADATEALDDLIIALSKENQRKTHRLGRMSRRGASSGSSVSTH